LEFIEVEMARFILKATFLAVAADTFLSTLTTFLSVGVIVLRENPRPAPVDSNHKAFHEFCVSCRNR